MEKLSPEKARMILQRNGIEVGLEQAGQILEFLRKMAKIAISNRKYKSGKIQVDKELINSQQEIQ